MRVWICQCLCPQRHCIAAAYDEAEDREDAEEKIANPLRETVDRWVAERVLNPWCGLCRAPREAGVFETWPTRWGSLLDASPRCFGARWSRR